MPNHVHVLFTGVSGISLGTIGGSWNETHFAAAESYVDQNPVKAGLVAEAGLWPYGSARLKV